MQGRMKYVSTPSKLPCLLQALDEQQKLITTVISVVAVLVANVSFIGYVTPPAGPDVYWKSCLYGTYIAFLVFNGLAFLFSLGSMAVVIVVPWLFPNGRASMRLVNRWTGWGLILLLLSVFSFTVAFVLAGLVTEGFWAPHKSCSYLPCEYGGMACSPRIQDGSLLSLNGVHGECFYVPRITTGQGLIDMSPGGNLSLFNGTTTLEHQHPDISGCFMVALKISNSDVSRFAGNSRNVLCHYGENPGKEAGHGEQFDLLNALVKLASPTQAWIGIEYDSKQEFWGLQISIPPESCNSTEPGCLCSSHMLAHQDELTFVTYNGPEFFPQSPILIAKSAASTDPDLNRFSYKEMQIVFGQDMTLYRPSVYNSNDIAVYDELNIRCSDSFDFRHPTLCLFDANSRGGRNKWYVATTVFLGDKPGFTQFERQCCFERFNCPCRGTAVDLDGNLIPISDLSLLAAKVDYNNSYVEHTASLRRTMAYIVFSILAVAFSLYIIISVFVCLALWC